MGLLRGVVLGLVVFACLVMPMAAWGQVYSLSLRVVDGESSEPLESAYVHLVEAGLAGVTLRDGVCGFPRLVAGEHRVVASYLGYTSASLTVRLRSDSTLVLRLHPSSLSMRDVVVTATRPVSKVGSVTRIDQAALEHVQPNSLSDVLQLLPGHLASDGQLGQVKQIALRQVGSDDNTALGTAVLVDGVPISNNANLIGRVADQKLSERSVMNRGVDLRSFSTDHYDRVDVVRGIASARHGDLSSGAIMLRAKRGVMPWQLRAKVDPLTSMLYAGKGFRLPVGTLHVGADLAFASVDERLPLESYRRYTAQANYTVARSVGEGHFELGVRGGYTGSAEVDREDPDLTNATNTYRAFYSRYNVGVEATLSPSLSWLQSVSFSFSGDVADDVLRRSRTVVLHGGMAQPIGGMQGEYEGVYLPNIYVSHYSLVSMPFNGFGRAEVKHAWRLLGMMHAVTWGSDARVSKNFGEGYRYDISTPPAPGSPTSSRPRRYVDIPAYAPLSAYVEDRVQASGAWGEVEMELGVRYSRLLQVESMYEHLRRGMFEPRLNLAYTLPSLYGDLVCTMRWGWGRQAKWPTLDQLTPTPAYFDFVSLNYYSQAPENRLLLMTTFTEDAWNASLRPAVVEKAEAGVDLSLGGAELQVTLFREEMRSGFTYSSHYMSYAYTRYDASGYTGGGKPSSEDLVPKPWRTLEVLQRPSNGLSTLKRGVEYRVSLPRWEAIGTSAMVGGGYFLTTYDVSEPVEYRPSHVGEGGVPYPYVGIYAFADGRKQGTLNTTLWLNTHIPTLRLIFSTMLQAEWINARQQLPVSGRPLYYRDVDGSVVEFTDEAVEWKPELRHLLRTYAPGYFDPAVTPFEMTVNLKVTKELGSHFKLSFFANRLLGVMPPYRGTYGRLVRRSYAPYFGAELKVSI